MLIGAREIESLWSHILGGGLRGRGGEKGSGGGNYLFFLCRGKNIFFLGNFYFALEFISVRFHNIGELSQ